MPATIFFLLWMAIPLGIMAAYVLVLRKTIAAMNANLPLSNRLMAAYIIITLLIGLVCASLIYFASGFNDLDGPTASDSTTTGVFGIGIAIIYTLALLATVYRWQKHAKNSLAL